MENRTFYTQFTLLNVFCIALVAASSKLPALAEHINLGWMFLLFFMGFVWMSYILGKRSATSPNKNNFTGLVLMLISLKMFGCIIIVLAYSKVAEPLGKFFAIYFLVLYVLYSIFEFYVLTKLGKSA